MSAEQDSVFVRNFAVVIVALTVVTVLLIFTANVFFGTENPDRAALAEERALQNLRPLYAVRLTGEPAPVMASTAPAVEDDGIVEVRSGEQVTQAVCIACHQGNFLNAPGIGDAEGWAARIGQGWATLIEHTAQGYGNMPAQGASATEEEIRAAIDWMIVQETGLEIPES